MEHVASSISERVHRIERELQVEAMWASVRFIQSDGWALAVTAQDGGIVHSWGAVDPGCVEACVSGGGRTINSECRGVDVGSTGHVLCGSRVTP